MRSSTCSPDSLSSSESVVDADCMDRREIFYLLSILIGREHRQKAKQAGNAVLSTIGEEKCSCRLAQRVAFNLIGVVERSNGK